ncbi:MAG: serine/threonine protein kinase [Acidobacteria bacterium]|nr:serine/threonine protein kinase [Acidobacteriota bacterium]
MTQLSDRVVAKLQAGMLAPDLTGTRYDAIRYLARGGMGSVWLVEDKLLHRHVALKVLDSVATADDLAVRLLQEARILAGLEHPGIVPVHDAGTLADGRAFYCMKYVVGETLAQHVVGMSLPDRLRLLERIAEPVDFAHARGFIHRDLKPDNIMIGAFGEVLVMDWGLARVGAADPDQRNEIAVTQESSSASSHVTGEGSVLGTPGYMSPEQSRGELTVDYRTDIFSLGAVLQFLARKPGPPNSLPEESSVPRRLQAICEKAMAADPNTRYQSAREMTADVLHYLGGEPVSAYPESLLERAGRTYARHSTAVILVAVYLLMRLLFILLARR